MDLLKQISILRRWLASTTIAPWFRFALCFLLSILPLGGPGNMAQLGSQLLTDSTGEDTDSPRDDEEESDLSKLTDSVPVQRRAFRRLIARFEVVRLRMPAFRVSLLAHSPSLPLFNVVNRPRGDLAGAGAFLSC